MFEKELPTYLEKNPLIDAVCGVRFDCEGSAESLLIGLLLQKFTNQNTLLSQLPVAQFPEEIRNSDPNLLYQPLSKIIVNDKFVILIGSKWLGVGCLMPYPGWLVFKDFIKDTFKVLDDIKIISKIIQHSMKYVNFFHTHESAYSLSNFELKISLGKRDINIQPTYFQTEIFEMPFVHLTTIVSKASTRDIENNELTGSIIDVDTHRTESYVVNDFLLNADNLLDQMHDYNKNFFFSLLTKTTLTKLEPHYGIRT